jgi:hypothetical protein
VYVPAVKDASGEQLSGKDTSFGRLFERVVRGRLKLSDAVDRIRDEALAKYGTMLDSNREPLMALTASLRTRLRDWAHPKAELAIDWQRTSDLVRVNLPVAAVQAGEAGYITDVSRLGHGAQRCYLLALFQELAGHDDATGPRLLLGIEEPELYQHPPQARHMAEVLRRLCEHNAQALISTHSPAFVDGDRVGDIRMLRRMATGATTVTRSSPGSVQSILRAAGENVKPSAKGTLAKIHGILNAQISEMFFSRRNVFVEGPSDVAYLTTYLVLLDLWDRFRAGGCNFVPVVGKNALALPVAISLSLKVPTFLVYDLDGEGGNEKTNVTLAALMGHAGTNLAAAAPLILENMVAWPLEVERTVRGEIGDGYDKLEADARRRFGDAKNLGKNGLFVADVLQSAWDAGLRSDSLAAACGRLIEWAEG